MNNIVAKLEKLEQAKRDVIEKQKNTLIKMIEDMGLLVEDEKLFLGALAKLKHDIENNDKEAKKGYLKFAEPYLKKFFRSRTNNKQKQTTEFN